MSEFGKILIGAAGGAFITGSFALMTLFINRGWKVKDEKAEDQNELRKQTEKNTQAISDLKEQHEADMTALKGELTVLCYGVLAALKGLSEKGCDGPVHDAIDTLEKHLNKQAHQ